MSKKKNKGFPMVKYLCYLCNGDGVVDVSYHGSPRYEDCPRCEGEENVTYDRKMTVDEKLDYLLKRVNR